MFAGKYSPVKSTKIYLTGNKAEQNYNLLSLLEDEISFHLKGLINCTNSEWSKLTYDEQNTSEIEDDKCNEWIKEVKRIQDLQVWCIHFTTIKILTHNSFPNWLEKFKTKLSTRAKMSGLHRKIILLEKSLLDMCSRIPLKSQLLALLLLFV